MKPEEAPLFSNMDDQGDTEIIGQAGDTDEKAEEIIVSTKSPEHALLKKISKDNTEEDQMITEIRKVEKMAKNEEETIACDPFKVRLSFSLAEKLRMTIFGVFLVPIRFISAQRCIYLVMWPHSWPQDFFFSCRNIQIRVFHANIFKSECFMQKYWSGTVTRYPVMRG